MYVSIHLSIVYYIINILKNLVTNIHNELLISNLFKIFFVILEKLIDHHITIAMYCNIKILIILSKNCLIFYFRSILIEDITSEVNEENEKYCLKCFLLYISKSSKAVKKKLINKFIQYLCISFFVFYYCFCF